MTDTQAQAPIESPELPSDAPPPPASPPRRNMVPWFYGFGFVVLAVAMVFLWQNPAVPPAPAQSDDVQALARQIQTLESRLGRLEQRPAGASDVAPLTARIDALEKRSPSDTGPLAARVAVLEQKAGGDVQIAGRVDALAGRLDALAGREQAGETELTRRIDAVAARVVALEQTAGQISGLADRAGRLARLQAAEAALAAGQPLGEIPGAPSALARFAAAKPPTEAMLRLTYPAAERAALAASRPDTDGKPFLDRVLARAQDLVTIRQGDHVILGDPAAGILARAHTALTAGDLPATVAAVMDLHGPAADAMADWRSQAEALLAAKAALADMAAHA